MKKTIKSLLGLSFVFFVGSFAYGQETTIREMKPIIFKTQAEKDAWISANPSEYARLKAEADQVTATFIGTLLQVSEPERVEVKVNKPLSEIELLEKEIEANKNNPDYNLELMKQKLAKAKEFDKK